MRASVCAATDGLRAADSGREDERAVEPVWVIVGILWTAAFSALTLGHYWNRRLPSVRSRTYLLMCTAIAIYCVGYALEITSKDLASALLYNRIQSFGKPYIGPLWAYLALQNTGRAKHFNVFMWFLLFLLPVGFTVAVWTPALFRSVYTSVAFVSNNSFGVLVRTLGPLCTVSSLNIFATSATALYCYAHAAFSHKTTRTPNLMLVVASVLPWLSVLLTTIGKSPYGLDTGPLALSLSLALSAIAFFRLRFTNVLPLAFEQVFQSIDESIVIVDRQRLIADFNRAAKTLLPELDAEKIGMPLREVLSERKELLSVFSDPEGERTSIVIEGADPRCCRPELVELKDNAGYNVGWMLTLCDITEQMESMRRLEVLAHYDSLTGAANRGYGLALLKDEIENARNRWLPLSLLMVDVDHFKAINDEHGHAVGDMVLNRLCAVCKQNIREADILLRYGGEEFVIVLVNTPPQKAYEVAERLRKAVQMDSGISEGACVQYTVSIGVAGVSRLTGEKPEELLVRADRALYTAKARGRNKTVLHEHE